MPDPSAARRRVAIGDRPLHVAAGERRRREWPRQPKTTKENAMNWTQIHGRWHQLAGEAKSQWAKLTDDDLKNVAGKREQLIGKLQERYGILKDDAEKQIDAWIAKVEPGQGDKPS
jgi:uncharacterized protein YjbJ (UPF0337 family)